MLNFIQGRNAVGFYGQIRWKSKSSNVGINDGDNDDAVPETVKLTLKEALSSIDVIMWFSEKQGAENIEIIHLRRLTDPYKRRKSKVKNSNK